MNVPLSFNITINGIEENIAREIANTVGVMIQKLAEVQTFLDLRRFNRIIIATDFSEALNTVAKEINSDREIKYTNEPYALAIAKVLLVPAGDTFEIILVFDGRLAYSLLINQVPDTKQENLELLLHLIHHEIVHVHEENKRIDALGDILLKKAYKAKEKYILPLAESLWAEYYANFHSALTAPEISVQEMGENFRKAVLRTKSELDVEIEKYRYEANLEQIVDYFIRHVGFLAKTAAYTFGYLSGLKTTIQVKLPNLLESLQDSYFAPVWNKMTATLTEMMSEYPGNLKDIGFYDKLFIMVEEYYDLMGFIFENQPDDGVYVHIPER